MVNLPFGDAVALRLVGSHSSTSGWLNRYVLADGAVTTDAGSNPTNSRPSNFYSAPLLEDAKGVNSSTSDSFRAILLFQPNDQLKITPMLMWQQGNSDAPNAVNINGSPTNPSMPTAKGHYEIYDTGEPQTDRFTLGSLKVEYAITPDIGLTSITGLWSNNSLVSQDGTEENSSLDGTRFYRSHRASRCLRHFCRRRWPDGPRSVRPGCGGARLHPAVERRLRVASTGSGPFQWLAGYYYQDFQSEWDMWSINPQAGPVANIYVDYQPQTILQNAAFGNVSWEFPFGLKASAGARWYHYSYSQRNSEWGDFTPYGFDNLVNPTGPTVAGNNAAFNTNASNSANGTNPRFNLTWQIDRDHMVYGTIAKGFRLGGTDQPFVGYQTPVTQTICSLPPSSLAVIEQCGLQTKLTATRSTPGFVYTSLANFPNVNSQGVPQFNSDSVWDYEIGTKNEFFDHRALLNLTAYFERWMDPQIATNISGFGFTVREAR